MDRRSVIKQSFKYYSNIIISALIDELETELSKKQKLIWTRKWLLRKDTHGNSVGLIRELAIEDKSEYKSFMRMTPEQFEFLLQEISPKIKREDTIMRPAIPAKIKLELTLSFLATGNSYRSLSHFFRVSKAAISIFVPEVLDAVFEALKDYIKVS